MRCLLMCRSLTYAQKAQRKLENAGIGAGILRAPKELSERGCAYCVSVSVRNGERAAGILRDAGLLYGKVYLQHDGGKTEEVRL